MAVVDASEPIACRRLPNIETLSDDEEHDARARAALAPANVQPSTSLAGTGGTRSGRRQQLRKAWNRHDARRVVSRIVVRNCACAGGACLRNFILHVNWLLDKRHQLHHLDKRDADRMVPQRLLSFFLARIIIYEDRLHCCD